MHGQAPRRQALLLDPEADLKHIFS